MLMAVIPAKNEAVNLNKVISKLPLSLLGAVVPVLNGCTDDSWSLLEELNCPLLAPVHFTEPLGIDVPRAVGAVAARQLDAKGVLFVDGDMHGVSTDVLEKLIMAVAYQGVDLALTNCYPGNIKHQLTPAADCLINVRRELNQRLCLYDTIDSATPSHGPHAVSGRLLNLVDPARFAVPPMLLMESARRGLRVAIAVETPHISMGSPTRSSEHLAKITETIIGDCIETMQVWEGKSKSSFDGSQELNGYRGQRRWDLLEKFTQGQIKGECYFNL